MKQKEQFKIDDYVLSLQESYNKTLKDTFFKIVDIKSNDSLTWIYVEGINNKIPFNLPLVYFEYTFIKVNHSTIEVLFGINR